MNKTRKGLMVLAILLLAVGAVWAGGQKDQGAGAAPAAAPAVPGKFNEAPMLAAMVKAGTIPPVEKRLLADVTGDTILLTCDEQSLESALEILGDVEADPSGGPGSKG